MSIDTTDQDLLARVRSGDTAAFGDLYAHHSAAAHRAARRIVRDPHMAEDLVSESFARVFSALRSDHGPQGDLFPYLLVTMRNLAATWGRDTGKWTPVGDDLAFQPRDARDLEQGADEAPVDQLAVSLTSSAFTTLPRRWRTVLWYLEVEGESATQVGERLGLTDVAVRQLARRAREGLREAYLTAYLGGGPAVGAHIPSNELVQMARGKLSARRRAQLEPHLDSCPQCTRLLFEAAEENSTLRVLAIPFYLAVGLALIKLTTLVGGWFRSLRPRGRLGMGAAVGASAATVAGLALLVATITGVGFGGSDDNTANGGGGPVTAGQPSVPAGASNPTAGVPPKSSASASAGPSASTAPGAPATTGGSSTDGSSTDGNSAGGLSTGGNSAGANPTGTNPTGTNSSPTAPPVVPPRASPTPNPDVTWIWEPGSVSTANGVTTMKLTIENTTAHPWHVFASFSLPSGVTVGSAQFSAAQFGCTQTGTAVTCALDRDDAAGNKVPLPPGWTLFRPLQFTAANGAAVLPPNVRVTVAGG